MTDDSQPLTGATIPDVLITGTVFTGLGQGASFTQIDWVRTQFTARLGIDPYPGTLNVRLTDGAALESWHTLQTTPGIRITAPDPNWCDARCYPVRIAGRLPGAIIYPEVPGYPDNQIELIAAIPLRRTLSVTDDDSLTAIVNQPVAGKGVIFDVDGTLVDSVPAYHAVAQQALAPYDIPVSLDLVRHALNINHRNFWDLAVPDTQPNRDEIIAAAGKIAYAQYPDLLRQHGSLMPNLADTLTRLQSKGLRLAIMTGSRGLSLQPLREAGLLDCFEVIVTSRDVPRPKPEPDGLLKVATDMNLPPTSLVYVGDSLVDIQASRAAGMPAIAVLSGAGDCAGLTSAAPHWVIPDVSHVLKVVKRV